MKFATRSLAFVAVLCLFGSLASAKPIRGEFTGGGVYFGVDVNGNLAFNSPNGKSVIKSIKFPKSGIIISRASQKNTLNASGKRQVFKNTQSGVFDPETMNFPVTSTRARRVFPKGKQRKNNLVRFRGLFIFNPKKAP